MEGKESSAMVRGISSSFFNDKLADAPAVDD